MIGITTTWLLRPCAWNWFLIPLFPPLLIYHKLVSLRYLASFLSNLILLRVNPTVLFLFPKQMVPSPPCDDPVWTYVIHSCPTGQGCRGQGLALAKVGKWKASLGNTSPEHQGAFPAPPVSLPLSHSGPRRSCPVSWVLEWWQHGSWAAADPWWSFSKPHKAYRQKQNHTQTDYPCCSCMKT